MDKNYYKVLRSMYVIITTDIICWLNQNCDEYTSKEITVVMDYLHIKLDDIFEDKNND
jgi:hypothetical protein